MTKKDLTAENTQQEPLENIEQEIVSEVPFVPEEVVVEAPETVEMVDEMPLNEEVVSEMPALAEITDELNPEEQIIPDIPFTEELSEENQAVEELVLETPAVEEMVPEDPVIEELVSETPVVEEMVPEAPVVEELVSETPAVEEIVPEAPVVEEIVSETPAVEEMVPETPVVEEIVSEVPVIEDVVSEIPVVEDVKSDVPVEEKHHPEVHADAALLKEIAELDDHAAIAEDEEEEEVMADHEQDEILEKYDTYDRDKLVEILEETVKEENILKIKTRVALIKVAFLRLSKENRQILLDNHIQAGGTRENYTPVPDQIVEKFNHVFETYKKNKIKFNEQQEVVKLRNLDAKKAILEELKELINSEETLKKTYDQFKDLQAKWKEIGLVPSTEINNLWQNYHFLVEKFFDKVKISKELRDLDLRKNLERKLELCEKAEELIIEPSVIRSFQLLQKYHEEWKEIGPVPQDKRDEIWERFKNVTDKINERRREHYTVLTKDQDENLIAKTALCEKAEQLASMEIDNLKDWQDKTREVNDLFKAWKTIGPAPKKENDEVWEKFKTFLNGFFNNKKEYFSKIKQEQLNNFNLKLDIVKQAEALKDSDDWRKTTQELINLQKEWKEIGPVPRKHSDKIWKRFRAACDEFFKNKAKFFSTVVESEKDNLEKKLDLIRRIEEWTAGKDKSANLDTLKGFQREFTEIGHVPIKDKNRIHDAFRQAINKHFDGLKINAYEMRPNTEYRPRHESSYDNSDDNRYQRRSSSGGSGEWGALSTKVSKLREEILLWENNIGFLAHSKKADLLRQEFEKKILDAKAELAQLEAKLKTMQD